MGSRWRDEETDFSKKNWRRSKFHTMRSMNVNCVRQQADTFQHELKKKKKANRAEQQNDISPIQLIHQKRSPKQSKTLKETLTHPQKTTSQILLIPQFGVMKLLDEQRNP